MTHQAEEQDNGTDRRPLWVLIGPLLLVGLILLFTIAGHNNRPLKPVRPTPTRGMSTVPGQPTLVSFAELNEDPTSFQNRRIRVTGSYMRLTPPDCSPYSGPGTRWALVNNEGETPLRLEAAGFESVLRLVPEDTILTVDGILRLYPGPTGCGKEPREPGPPVWYLEAEQIVQPNPLPQVTPGRPVPERSASTPTADTTVTPGRAETATITPGTVTPTPTDDAASPTPAFIPDVTVTPTPTAGSATPTTPTTGTATATASRTPTPTRTGTAQPGGTATPTPTHTGTPAPGATQPSFATATPGSGYPPPSGTATPTATSGSSYP